MTYENEYRDGALACHKVLVSLRPMLAGDRNQTTAEYFDKFDMAIAAVLAVAGPMPPRAAGAIACIAEMIISGEQDGGFYGIGDISQCQAAMTQAERDQARLDFTTCCDAEFQQSNVVSSR